MGEFNLHRWVSTLFHKTQRWNTYRGFRKSLFGYNQEDVAEYINRQAVKNTEIQTELNAKIKANAEQINELTEKLEKLNTENAELNEKIAFYREKYEEVKTLSDNIGKLYLVAQTNAKAIMSAADQAKNATDNEIEQNIAVIDSTNEMLNTLKAKVAEVCDNFKSDVDKLNSTLLDAKATIEGSAIEHKESLESFDKLYASLKK